MPIHVTKMSIRAMITITQYNISQVIIMQIIHLNQYLSNEKTLMQIWALLTALHMAKWLHQSSILSVLRLSLGMGEYYSPSNK